MEGLNELCHICPNKDTKGPVKECDCYGHSQKRSSLDMGTPSITVIIKHPKKSVNNGIAKKQKHPVEQGKKQGNGQNKQQVNGQPKVQTHEKQPQEERLEDQPKAESKEQPIELSKEELGEQSSHQMEEQRKEPETVRGNARNEKRVEIREPEPRPKPKPKRIVKPTEDKCFQVKGRYIDKHLGFSVRFKRLFRSKMRIRI